MLASMAMHVQQPDMYYQQLGKAVAPLHQLGGLMSSNQFDGCICPGHGCHTRVLKLVEYHMSSGRRT